MNAIFLFGCRFIDAFTAIGEGKQDWVRDVAGLTNDLSIVPFEDTENLGSALRTLDLMLKRENLSISTVIRLNIFCLDNLNACLQLTPHVNNLVSRVVFILQNSVLGNASDLSKLLDSLREFNLTRLVIYYNSFPELYRNLKVIGRISSVVPTSLIARLRDVMDDLNFLKVIAQCYQNISLGFIVRNPDEMLGITRNAAVQLLCRRIWLFNEVVTCREDLKNLSVKPLYLVIPTSNVKVLGIMRSGAFIADGESAHPADVEVLKEVLLNRRYDPSVMSGITISLGIKVGGGIVISEDDIRVLELVEKYGCLKKVAEAVGVSYMVLRKRLAELERELGVKIILSQRGGSERGSTELSPFGRGLLSSVKPILIRAREALLNHGLNQYVDFGSEVCGQGFIE